MLKLIAGALFMGLFSASLSCARPVVDYKSFPSAAEDLPVESGVTSRTIVLAGGCFWCTEGVFERVPGVTDVVSGYAGGTAESAKYEEVGAGRTGHAEAIQITYDPSKVSFGKILKLFFAVAHDPTQLNRQGPDSGKQYRSAIFYSSEDEKRVSEAYIKQLDGAKVFESPIVTTLEPLKEFYPAEAYHQDFIKRNPDNGYILQQAVPKLEKLKKALGDETGSGATTKPAGK